MASLNPGVLLKLLQSMNTDTKVGGEHRSVLLQVIGIVPALSGPDLWPSHGFYIQLSDSANSTYVSLPDSDADVFLSNRPQLGQFVHLERLHFQPPSSVPRAAGLRSIPGRPHPFLGTPEPLVARVSPNHQGFIIQTASSDHPPPPPPPLQASAAGEGSTRTVFSAKENVGTNDNRDMAAAATKRRFSSPAAVKLAGRKTSGGERDPSPASKAGIRPASPAPSRSNSRPSSPVPSKCEVPGLVAAKEENRRVAREPAIVVPSRYRQPSPVGGRKAASPMARRNSSSPARRLSGGFKVSPLAGESKKKMAAVVAGISKVSDALMSSTKSIRKSWDDAGPNSGVSTEHKGNSKSSKVDKQAALRAQVAILRRLSDVSSRQTNDEEVPMKEKPNSSPKTVPYSPVEEKAVPMVPKITVHDRKWSDGTIPLDALPDNIAKLGKEAMQRRNAASTAAAEAIEEACATESIIRCMSMFSDLCSSSKAFSPLLPIDRFLSIYDDMIESYVVAKSLASRWSSDGSNDTVASTAKYQSISLWIEAALATDLEVVSLLSKETGNFKTKQKSSEKLNTALRTAEKLSPVSSKLVRPHLVPKRYSTGTPVKNNSTRNSQKPAVSSTWMRGCGVGETAELAGSLRIEMEKWFLQFVEQALDAGFQLLGDSCGRAAAETPPRDNSHVAAVLSHLKRVNDWLDGVGKTPDDQFVVETIERLKRKIYGFVIRHVGSAFDGSISISS